MKKVSLNNICLAIAVFVYGVAAVQPNFVEIRTYDVDGNINYDADTTNDVVTTLYTDGFGKGIQSKLRLNAVPTASPPIPPRDRVSCTFHDEVGRPDISTKSFIDTRFTHSFLPGGIADPDIREQLESSNNNDTRAYSKSEYWDDPLGRVKKAFGPGDTATYGVARSWVFGVMTTEADNKIGYVVTDIGTVDIVEGIITKVDVTDATKKIADLLDGLYTQFITTNPYTSPDHILAVSLSPDGKISEELKDKFGRTVTTFSAPDSGTVAGSKISSHYDHDILGNVLTEFPPSAAIANTCYKYNSLGQLIWKQTPDGGKFAYEYNPDGSLAAMKSMVDDVNWEMEISYEYDDLGRKTRMNQRIYSYDPVLVQKFYYDDAANIPVADFSVIEDRKKAALANLKGRLVASVTVNRGVEIVPVGELYSYDDEGRVLTKYMTIGDEPQYQEITYTYDIHGKVTTESFYYGNDHLRKRFVYDELGVVASVYSGYRRGDGTYHEQELVRNEYDSLGLLTAKKFPAISSSYDVTYGYDIRDRLISSATPAGSQGYEQTLKYDISGNIDTSRHNYILESAQPYTQTYGYDDVNRLRTADCPGHSEYDASYEYDKSGRFVSKTEGASAIHGYAYYPTTNRLKSAGTVPANGQDYIFDKRGNVVVDFGKKLVIEYDWRDLPVTFNFYNDLVAAGITKDDSTGTCTITDLYGYLIAQRAAGTVQLLSTVRMLYDAGGNRVCKMNVAN